MVLYNQKLQIIRYHKNKTLHYIHKNSLNKIIDIKTSIFLSVPMNENWNIQQFRISMSPYLILKRTLQVILMASKSNMVHIGQKNYDQE